MKKLLIILLMLFKFNIWSQNSFTGSIIYLDINNSGSNSSYDLSSSGGTDFHNADLGTFEIGTSDLKLTGVQHNVNRGSNINEKGKFTQPMNLEIHLPTFNLLDLRILGWINQTWQTTTRYRFIEWFIWHLLLAYTERMGN